MTSLNAGTFEERMAPTVPQTDPPVTWSGWWSYPIDKAVTVPNVGEVTKIVSTEEPDSDSYNYNQVRTMVFRIGGADSGPRFFRVSATSSSFDSDYAYESNEAWSYADVDEVYPEAVQATRWVVVRR